MRSGGATPSQVTRLDQTTSSRPCWHLAVRLAVAIARDSDEGLRAPCGCRRRCASRAGPAARARRCSTGYSAEPPAAAHGDDALTESTPASLTTTDMRKPSSSCSTLTKRSAGAVSPVMRKPFSAQKVRIAAR